MGGGEEMFDRKAKSLQAVKEGLKSKFSKYGNPVKVVTSSGAHGNTHLDPSVSAISSQGAQRQQEQSSRGGLGGGRAASFTVGLTEMV